MSRSRWIISPLADAFFFVGTPVLCAAFILPLGNIWTSFDIWLVVMTFSSFGHHLPGFIRAYGDRELFARYRARFLLAPPLLLGAFLFFGFNSLHGLALVLMAWSIWHVMMQHYGFMRIYDAKQGSMAPWTARLDWLMCLLWFVTVVIWSPQYMHNLLANLYQSGMPFISPGVFNAVSGIITGVTLSVTGVYVVYTVLAIRAGQRISAVKLVLMVMTISFLYLVWVVIDDIMLGLAVWEVYHDVQYFAIVWIYNRRLVDKGALASGVMRFLFRPRPGLILLYMAMIVTYGGFNFAVEFVDAEAWRTGLMAVVFTSTILHYYYDGFIWKVRQQRTQSGLDIDATSEQSSRIESDWFARIWTTLTGSTQGVRSAMAQWAYFVVPIGGLAFVEFNRPNEDKVGLSEAIAAVVPTAVQAHTNLAAAYGEAGRLDDAVAAFETGLRHHPNNPKAHDGRGMAILERGGPDALDAAAAGFEAAIRSDPRYPHAYTNLGNVRMTQGRVAEAVEHYQRAIGLDPGGPDAYFNLGNAYLNLDRIDDAVETYHAALALRPDFVSSQVNLAGALLKRGDRREAVDTVRRALELDPSVAEAHQLYGVILVELNQLEEAMTHFRQAVQQKPEYLAGYDGLASVAEQLGRFKEAAVASEQIALLDRSRPGAHVRWVINLLRARQTSKAVSVMRGIIAQNPADNDTKIRLAEILATSSDDAVRNGAEAVRLATEVVTATNRQNAGALDVLAAACAETGDFDRAIREATAAVKVAAAQNQEAAAEMIRRRIRLYEAGIAYHENVPVPPLDDSDPQD